jgi:hypothetical protein
MTPTLTDKTASAAGAAAAIGADLISAVAAESNEELASALAEDFGVMTAAQGRIALRLGEVERRQAFRDDGATSVEAWTTERFGVSAPSARALSHVGAKAWDLPHLVGALCAGDITFDKGRVVADAATPETERALCAQAKELSLADLADVARTEAARRPSGSSSESEHDRRYLRFNDTLRTLSAQLSAEAYAATKACIDAWSETIASDGETPLDQRRCDGFSGLMASVTPGATMAPGEATTKRPFLVVAHVALDALVTDSGEPSELAGELEHGGLIDVETVRRIACDATIALGVDDDVGHTMYEGRAQRFATPTQRCEVMRRDRHCRFPGCRAVTFVNVHHVVPWKPGGTTDLDNLALACDFHHHLVHTKGWTMTGDANGELSVVGPSGRVMTSRPSPLWTRVTGAPRRT